MANQDVQQVSARHILVKNEHEAKDLLVKIGEGVEFEKLAQDFSTCPSGKKGGALGSFTRGRMVKEFEDAAFNLEVGKVSDIVKTRFGYHLIKREA
ncbi:MAG: peptidylprolyl isomerase [Bacteriovoracaceae bacterium]